MVEATERDREVISRNLNAERKYREELRTARLILTQHKYRVMRDRVISEKSKQHKDTVKLP